MRRPSFTLVASFTPMAALASLCSCGNGAPPPTLPPVAEIVYDARTELEAPVVLPLLSDRLPVIEVEIAGCGRARFIVDSAMEITMLDRGLARRCGLPVRGYAFELTVRTSDGALARVEEAAHVARLGIGGASAFDLDMPLVDVRAIIADVDGFLGQDVIGDWALLFRREQRELVILPSGDLLKSLGAYLPKGTPMESMATASGDDRLLRVDFDFDTVVVRLDVDTGATATTLPPAALAVIGASGGMPTESATLAGKQARRAWKVSGFPLGKQRIDLVIESTDADHGLLGYDALSQRTFVLDGPGRRVLIAASASEAAK